MQVWYRVSELLPTNRVHCSDLLLAKASLRGQQSEAGQSWRRSIGYQSTYTIILVYRAIDCRVLTAIALDARSRRRGSTSASAPISEARLALSWTDRCRDQPSLRRRSTEAFGFTSSRGSQTRDGKVVVEDVVQGSSDPIELARHAFMAWAQLHRCDLAMSFSSSS